MEDNKNTKLTLDLTDSELEMLVWAAQLHKDRLQGKYMRAYYDCYTEGTGTEERVKETGNEYNVAKSLVGKIMYACGGFEKIIELYEKQDV